MADSDDLEHLTDLNDVEQAVNEVENAIERVEDAIERVEKAVKDRRSWSFGWFVFAGFCVFGLLDLFGSAFHSKYWYVIEYSVNVADVQINSRPHDCDFLAAPLGAKYCEYERRVSTIMWATSGAGLAIASYDHGKTWSVFTPDPGDKVPQNPKVVTVIVDWEKKDKD